MTHIDHMTADETEDVLKARSPDVAAALHMLADILETNGLLTHGQHRVISVLLGNYEGRFDSYTPSKDQLLDQALDTMLDEGIFDPRNYDAALEGSPLGEGGNSD